MSVTHGHSAPFREQLRLERALAAAARAESLLERLREDSSTQPGRTAEVAARARAAWRTVAEVSHPRLF